MVTTPLLTLLVITCTLTTFGTHAELSEYNCSLNNLMLLWSISNLSLKDRMNQFKKEERLSFLKPTLWFRFLLDLIQFIRVGRASCKSDLYALLQSTNSKKIELDSTKWSCLIQLLVITFCSSTTQFISLLVCYDLFLKMITD